MCNHMSHVHVDECPLTAFVSTIDRFRSSVKISGYFNPSLARHVDLLQNDTIEAAAATLKAVKWTSSSMN